MRLPPEEGRTTNALIHRSLFDEYTFDPDFGLSGGGDLELFLRMSEAGARFYWCDEALTYEYYPPERARFRWLLQRTFRRGMVYTRIDKKRRPAWWRQGLAFLRACAGIGVLTSILPIELLRGRTQFVKCLLKMSLQVGHIYALCNLTYEEYKVRDPHRLSGVDVNSASDVAKDKSDDIIIAGHR
jgi:succinoglycan biosynthesis protein ExoM